MDNGLYIKNLRPLVSFMLFHMDRPNYAIQYTFSIALFRKNKNAFLHFVINYKLN